ncbi:MAG TPA: GAF domain-containing protein [Woeseiaceae bacterium]
MNPGLAIRSAITLLAVACLVYTVFLVQSQEFPFTWRTVDSHTLVIEPRSGIALPPNLEAGDRLDLREQDLRTRTGFYTDSLPGESYVLQVRRDGTTFSVPVPNITGEGTGLIRLYEATLFLVLVLGLTTLWWGRDWAAWGLSLFAHATIVNFFLFSLPLPPLAAFVAVLLNQTIVAPLLVPAGLYISAFALAGPVITARLRRSFHLFFVLVLLANFILLCTQTVGYVVFGSAVLERTGLAGLLFAISIFTPLAVLLVALPRADAARRLRLRWILLSLALFIGAIAWSNLAQLSDAFSTRGFVRQAIWWTALLCGLTGLLYVVLRKRVVSMSFAINRALVYGLVAALVIGVFGALTVLLENTAIGSEAGVALTVGISIAIGVVLEALRDRINVMVERIFFRQRYEAEAALRRFARECAYIENADRLLDEAQEEIHRHLRPDASAFYETRDKGYVRVRRRGDPTYPEWVDVDDRAFVSMRADREPVDLRDVTSALGNDGFVFPMAVRGVLGGALVCGPRIEAYTRDERSLLAELAQQVGTALHALRARDKEALVRALARGEINLSTARQRARAVQFAS